MSAGRISWLAAAAHILQALDGGGMRPEREARVQFKYLNARRGFHLKWICENILLKVAGGQALGSHTTRSGPHSGFY